MSTTQSTNQPAPDPQQRPVMGLKSSENPLTTLWKIKGKVWRTSEESLTKVLIISMIQII